MKYSIKRFLLVNLLVIITLSSALTVVSNYFLDDFDIKHQLDSPLVKTTNLIEQLLIKQKGTNHDLNALIPTVRNSLEKCTFALESSEQLQFSVWNKQGKLIISSSKDIIHPVKQLGFSTIKHHQLTWRVYTKYNHDLKVTIAAKEPYDFRDQLEKRISWDNLLVILWIYPVLAFLIWITVTKGLNGLHQLSKKISKRNATDFSLLQLEGMPLEIQPVIDALNKLFERLDAEFTRNKRFASDAAHELRTPLAALKTQTQVALLTTDEQEKKKILKNIVLSVDRLTHVVHQLLTMSRLSKEDTIQNITQFDLAQLAAEVIAEIVPNALKKNINIELIKDRTPSIIEGNHVGLSILIRNLVDNAIRYSPENSFVKVILINHPSTVTLKVIDNGPGIPDELRERIFERFYRIPGTQEIGSGLGLSIVKQIVDLHHARIHLAKTNNCFEIDIVLHKKLP